MFKALLEAEEADFLPEETTDDGFTPAAEATPAQVIDAKVATAEWLKELGAVEDVHTPAQLQTAAQNAQSAFVSLTAPLDQTAQHRALAKVDTPEAVKHLVGMLTAYDWAFVEQAKEIRAYCISVLLEESKHPDAKYRLKAVELLGKVTEVALFTERLEVKKVELSDTELEEQIRQRMERYYALAKTVEGVEVLPPEDAIRELLSDGT